MDGKTEIYPNLFLDWESKEPIRVTDTSLEFGARAIVSSESSKTPATFPEMPYKDDAYPSGFQVFLSSEAVNSAFAAYLEEYPVQYWLNATDIPESSPMQLNTHDLEKAFPGIDAHYGPDPRPVNVYVDLVSLSGFSVAKGKEQVSLNGAIDLKFFVDTADGASELAVDLSLTKLYMEASILIDGYNVTGSFTKLQARTIKVNDCAFGDLSAFKVKVELNVGMSMATDPINEKIAAFVIPSHLYGLFELSDLRVGYFDGFLMAGATPTFLVPKYKSFQYVADSFAGEESTCTGPHARCCPAVLDNVDNCPRSARTSDCDAERKCCCFR